MPLAFCCRSWLVIKLPCSSMRISVGATSISVFSCCLSLSCEISNPPSGLGGWGLGFLGSGGLGGGAGGVFGGGGGAGGGGGGSSLLIINCWLAPAAISWALIVMTFGEVFLLE